MVQLVVVHIGDHTGDHLAQMAPFELGNALFLLARDGLVALFLSGLAPCAIASLPRASFSPEKRAFLCHCILQVYHRAQQGDVWSLSASEAVR